MITKKLFFIFFLMLFQYELSLGYETDQFTTPDGPLADVGEDFTAFFLKEISVTVEEVNGQEYLLAEIEKLESRLIELKEKEVDKYDSPHASIPLGKKIKKLKERLELMQTASGIVRLISDRIGGAMTWQDQLDGVFGLPFSIFPYENNLKNNMPITYIPSRFNTIYSYSGFHRIISPTYFVMCSTMQAYGVYFGSDNWAYF